MSLTDCLHPLPFVRKFSFHKESLGIPKMVQEDTFQVLLLAVLVIVFATAPPISAECNTHALDIEIRKSNEIQNGLYWAGQNGEWILKRANDAHAPNGIVLTLETTPAMDSIQCYRPTLKIGRSPVTKDRGNAVLPKITEIINSVTPGRGNAVLPKVTGIINRVSPGSEADLNLRRIIDENKVRFPGASSAGIPTIAMNDQLFRDIAATDGALTEIDFETDITEEALPEFWPTADLFTLTQIEIHKNPPTSEDNISPEYIDLPKEDGGPQLRAVFMNNNGKTVTLQTFLLKPGQNATALQQGEILSVMDPFTEKQVKDLSNNTNIKSPLLWINLAMYSGLQLRYKELETTLLLTTAPIMVLDANLLDRLLNSIPAPQT